MGIDITKKIGTSILKFQLFALWGAFPSFFSDRNFDTIPTYRLVCNDS
jgi:hypothetical protein